MKETDKRIFKEGANAAPSFFLFCDVAACTPWECVGIYRKPWAHRRRCIFLSAVGVLRLNGSFGVEVQEVVALCINYLAHPVGIWKTKRYLP